MDHDFDDLATPKPRPGRSWWSRWGWFVGGAAVVGLVLAVVLARGVEKAREAAARSMCNLGQITLALHNYQEANGCLPPAVVRDEQGRPLHGWRVLILPFLEQNDLYREFHLDEPWDSPHNLPLVDRMPSTYRSPWDREVKLGPGQTILHVLVGPGTLFEPGARVRIPDDVPDGPSRTLLFVEAGPPVPWTKPEEIELDANPARPLRLRGVFHDGFRACEAGSARYRFIRHDVDPPRLHAAATRDGGETLPPAW